MRELLMGNEAIALGALAAGVQVVSGYPGTPSSEVLETIAKRNPGGVHVEWSVNEKAGAEVAAGAAYSGARAMVTMKQMGLNVASDPVMCVNYIGVEGGLVIYVADDPGPISSQTEQDTRHFGQYAKIPVFDCDSPEQAFWAVQDAFDFSEQHGTPVILRSTTRVCHACADVEVPAIEPPGPAPGFEKDPKWVIFPKLSYQNKQKLVARESDLAEEFSDYAANTVEGSGPIGIACGGISYAYVSEAITGYEDMFTVLKIATPYPFPSKLAGPFMEQVEKVIVFEELDPVIEDALIYEAGRRTAGASPAADASDAASDAADAPAGTKGTAAALCPVLGKRTGTVPAAGELSADIVAQILRDTAALPAASDAAGDRTTAASACAAAAVSDAGTGSGTSDAASAAEEGPACPEKPELPVRPPVLCAGCPHRGSFYAVKQAVAGAERAWNKNHPAQDGDSDAFPLAVYHGDIGCYTLGNAAPLNMVDTCLCMGAGITMAQGMDHADQNTLNFAFVGDSTFFASGITGTVNAVYNQADMILCILDNSTTAMTGHQPHPGMGITMMGKRVEPVDIGKVLEGIGVPWIRTVDPLDYDASVRTVTEAIGEKGVRAIIFKSPCIALFKPAAQCRVDADACIGCMRCVNEIGCPALTPEAGSADGAGAGGGGSVSGSGKKKRAHIDSALCNGCGLCAQLCPVGCIGKEALK